MNVFTVGTYTAMLIAVRRGRLGGANFPAKRFGTHRRMRGAGHIVAAPAQLVICGVA